MAFNRCFNTYNSTIQSASDYSTSLRQNTIYANVAQNMIDTGNGNPVKNNGYQYNDNFSTVPLTISSSAGCLVNAKSYDLLLDVTKGMMYRNTELGSNAGLVNKSDAWAGNFFSVDYADKGVDVVVDTSYNAGNTNQIIFPQTISAHDADLSFNNSYPGVIVDPCYNIFYNPCLLSYNDGKNPWIRLVQDVTFQDSNLYNQVVNSDPLYGINYPQKVIFKCDEGCGSLTLSDIATFNGFNWDLNASRTILTCQTLDISMTSLNILPEQILTNNGVINGTIINTGTLVNNNIITILINYSGGTVNNNDTINNLTNEGLFNNNTGGIILELGDNIGTINNNSGGTINIISINSNDNGIINNNGEINNTGTIYIFNSGAIDNTNGVIDNSSGSIYRGDGTGTCGTGTYSGNVPVGNAVQIGCPP